MNRKAISKELLNFSLKNQSKQFIFISPQVILHFSGFVYKITFNLFMEIFVQGACDLSNVDHGVVSVTEIKKS